MKNQNNNQRASIKTPIIIGVLILIVIVGVVDAIRSGKQEIKPEETASILDSVAIEETNKEQTIENELSDKSTSTEEQIVEVKEELLDKSVSAPIITKETKDQEEQIVDNIETTQYYKVIKVIDGDTLTIDNNGTSEVIRLIGINTPETVDPRKPVECFGVEASNKAKELLSNQWVELESDSASGEKDKYGRTLRYVRTKNGLFYNLEIIEQGYAYEYTYNISYKYQAEFKQAENYAKSNKLGLWADGVCEESEPETPEVVIESEPEPEQTSCDCSSNRYNCTDFSTHNEAQSLFDCCGGVSNDIHRLDSDKDGVACESLP